MRITSRITLTILCITIHTNRQKSAWIDRITKQGQTTANSVLRMR